MTNGIFDYISGIALLSYMFMLMIFINAEKNRIVNAFLLLLVSMILWTGGSLFMRLQVVPSYILWYHVSLGGLMLIIYSYFRFITAFIGKDEKAFSVLYLILLVISFAANVPSGILLHWPTIQIVDSKSVMVYDKMNGFVSILFILSGIIVTHMLTILVKGIKKNPSLRKQLTPVMLGIIALFSGNLLLVLPIFSGFPIDIVAGVVNAGFLFYVLVRKQLFKLKMMASENVGYLFCIVLGFVIFYSIMPMVDAIIEPRVTKNDPNYMSIYLLSFVAVVSMLFYLWKKVITSMFIREEESQNEILKQFSLDVSKSLNLSEIFDKTVRSITAATDIQKIYIGMLDHTTQDFVLRYSDQSLADLSFILRKDNPIIQLCQKSDDFISLDDIEHTIAYKSMWEKEKQQLQRLGTKYCIGLKENNQLIGVILFSNYGKKKPLRHQDFNIISSISSVATIALKNAHSYEKAFLEARTDDLTGVLNRRYFYEIIQDAFEKNKDGSLALIIISLDDFKLYNQLYGVKQGDSALKAIADVIKASIGQQGYIARYSGKEFAILLPGYDVFTSKKLSESMRDQIAMIGKSNDEYRYKAITISVGISVAPFGATNVKELLDNADQAVYQVKRKGKNAIKVFDTYVRGDKSNEEETDYAQVYDEYRSTIYALTAAIDAKDHYTFSHSDNVATLAVALATELKLNKTIVENIRQAALLHDIGKISISENILNKPGKLNSQEYLTMQSHVEASIDIIRHLPSLDYVIPAVLGHHERYDGKGYPRRISKDDIPLTARILCIADAFDAMVSKRCYKSEIPVDEALRILESESGKQFDPELVHLFVEMIQNDKIASVQHDRLKVVKG